MPHTDVLMATTTLRDFVYLDADRVRSIVAQLEEGVVDSLTKSKGSSAKIESGIEGSLFGLLKGAGGATYLWRRDATETRTLHDYIYTNVESRLLKDNLLVKIPGDLAGDDILSRELGGKLSPTSFILAEGRVTLNDFGRMRRLIDRFNDIGKFLAWAECQKQPAQTLSKNKARQLRQQKQDEMSIDKRLQDGLRVVIDAFYEDRLVLRLSPFAELEELNLVGNLKQEHLREDIGSVIFKYGTAPDDAWHLFAQVAAIPAKNKQPTPQESRNVEGIEPAFQKMFDAVRELEATLEPISYPEIAVTPIAVYRA